MTLITIAILFTACLFLCEWAFAKRRRSLEAAMALRDGFFASAESLVRDPETPQSIVELLEACANSITSPEVGRLVIRRALANRLPQAGAGEQEDEESRRFLQDVYGMRAELRDTLAQAAMQYAQAASFNNPVLGGVARRLSAAWLAGPAQRQSPRSGRPDERLMIDITPRLIAHQSSSR